MSPNKTRDELAEKRFPFKYPQPGSCLADEFFNENQRIHRAHFREGFDVAEEQYLGKITELEEIIQMLEYSLKTGDLDAKKVGLNRLYKLRELK